MYPEINLIFTRIGSFTLFAGMGLVSLVCLALRQAKTLRLDGHTEQLVMQSIPIVVIPAVIPAALADIVFRWPRFVGNPQGFGVAFYGWLIGCISGWFLYGMAVKLRPRFILNYFAPSLALAQSIGRIGCFLGGCCYGRPVGRAFGVIFPERSLPWIRYGSAPLCPVQLLDSFWLFCVFMILSRRVPFRFRMPAYLTLVGVGRFFTEFLRGDDRGTFFGIDQLSPAQCTSALLVVCGVTFGLVYILSDLGKRRHSSEEQDRSSLNAHEEL